MIVLELFALCAIVAYAAAIPYNSRESLSELVAGATPIEGVGLPFNNRFFMSMSGPRGAYLTLRAYSAHLTPFQVFQVT
jgi:hypothetical protein